MGALGEALLGNAPPPSDSFDAGFVRWPGLTLLHIIPGFVFMVLGPLQFVTTIRSRYPSVHRWCGRIYLASGLIIGVSGLILGFVIGFGGPTETVAVTIFSSLFLVFLGRALFHIRRREIAAHREWMIRAFALGLSIATMRPMVGILTALADQSFSEALGISFWFAFSLHLLLAELWVNLTRQKQTLASAIVPAQIAAVEPEQ
jgi:uncharacterized membrane protein